WGYSQPYSAPGLEHEVRERDYFFIASFAAWGIWVAFGLATVMEWIQQALAARAPAPSPARRWALSAVVLLLAIVPLAGHRLTAPWMSRFYRDGPADPLPPYLELPQPVTARLGPVTLTLDPNALGRPYLERAELAVLQIIKDQVGKRPIYFSASTGNYGDRLGLGAYLVGEGLVRRVLARPAAPS